jgi:hypothetical protein
MAPKISSAMMFVRLLIGIANYHLPIADWPFDSSTADG